MDLMNVVILLAGGFGAGCLVGSFGGFVAKMTIHPAVTFRVGEPLLLIISPYQKRNIWPLLITAGIVVIIIGVIIYDRYYPETLEPLNIVCAGEHCWP